MIQGNTTTYIKKLVKIVYEKEKQIQNMKKLLRDKSKQDDQENQPVEIHQDIRKQVQYTSTRMKQLGLHVLSMQNKMLQVQKDLQRQIQKNNHLQHKYDNLQEKYQKAKKTISEQCQSLIQFQNMIRQLVTKKEKYQNQMLDANRTQLQKIQLMKDEEEKLKLNIIKLQTKITQITVQLRDKNVEIKEKSDAVELKNQQNLLLTEQLVFKQEEISKLSQELNQITQNYNNFLHDFSMLKLEVQTLQDSINMKQSQFQLTSQTLKDYEEFCFQISQYIESSYIKHCCQGRLRSSKKIIREVDNCKTRFQSAFCKMNQISNWMDTTAQKLQKIIEQHELPNQTLQNLSIIAHSFEQKLELCDLTQRIERQKIENDKNEEILLDNLQKQIQKSQFRDRSKLVQLDEVKQVLKVTKDINRELLTQLNSKQYIISECRKLFIEKGEKKETAQYRNLKNMLNIK